MATSSGQVTARHVANLRAFVVRARRVEEHSLGRDRERLAAWAQGKMVVRVHPDGRSELMRLLPDEELLDSLAARCRPFILKGDPVHHGRVLNALGYLTPQSATTATLDAIRGRWKSLDPDSDDQQLLGYSVQVRRGDEAAFSGTVGDKALAYAWLYGDLVHASTVALSDVAPHQLDTRFEAATLLVANLAMMAIATLNLVRTLTTTGDLAIDNDVFVGPVVARGERWLPAAVVGGPARTPAEELRAALDSVAPTRI